MAAPNIIPVLTVAAESTLAEGLLDQAFHDLSDVALTSEIVAKILEASPDPITLTELDTGRYLMVNHAFCEVTGFKPEQVIGNTAAKLGVWGSEVERKEVISRLRREKHVRNVTAKMRDAAGRELTAQISFSLVRIGKQKLVLSAGRDCTEQIHMREALRRQALIFKNIQDCVLITDLDRVIVDSNPAVEAILGFSSEELVGQRPDVFLRAVDWKLFEGIRERLDHLETWKGETDAVHKNGTALKMELTIVGLRDDDGALIGYVGIARDVTDKRTLEAQFQHAQKMEAVGRLAGSVAHDFNNVLAIISGYAELGLMDGCTQEKLQHYLTTIRDASTKAANVTRQLLTFSRKDSVDVHPLNLDLIITDICKMMGRILGPDIDMFLALNSKAANIRADRGQIEQVIMNLAVNARDAMPSGGKLSISTWTTALGPFGVSRPYVVCSVSDTGIGMSEEIKQRIFEPFFTTKGTGKGTGLGLATVYGIVKKAGGYIEVDSVEGQGTTFQLYFPIAERRTGEQRVSTLTAPARGKETVLLVDDEEPFRKAAGEYLADLGYKVVQAGSAAEALEVCPASVDVIVTDVLMPGGVRGPQLCEKLGDRHPRVIFISGDPEFGSAIDAVKGERFLRKPFRLMDLAGTIRHSLDTKPQPQTGAGM